MAMSYWDSDHKVSPTLDIGNSTVVKVEAGEDIATALRREFMEELGVSIVCAEAWCCVEHVYPHAHVRLHFISHVIGKASRKV